MYIYMCTKHQASRLAVGPMDALQVVVGSISSNKNMQMVFYLS